MPTTWTVETLRGSAEDLHHRVWPAPLTRTVWRCEVDRPAIVLGSGQREDVVDRAAAADAGIDVVRRRGGGGAVLLVPDEFLWLDVFVPPGDPLWRDDIGHAFGWLGRTWAAAVEVTAGRAAVVHEGPLVAGLLGSLVCFAGRGPGEVLVDGAKAVGLSQRRTRAGARFQCLVHRRWSPERYGALLSGAGGDRTGVETGIGAVDVWCCDDVDALATLVIDRLP